MGVSLDGSPVHSRTLSDEEIPSVRRRAVRATAEAMDDTLEDDGLSATDTRAVNLHNQLIAPAKAEARALTRGPHSVEETMGLHMSLANIHSHLADRMAPATKYAARHRRAEVLHGLIVKALSKRVMSERAQLAREDGMLTPTEHELIRAHAETGDHLPLHGLIDSLEERGSPLHLVVRRAIQAHKLPDAQDMGYGLMVGRPRTGWVDPPHLTVEGRRRGSHVATLTVDTPGHTVHFIAPLRHAETAPLKPLTQDFFSGNVGRAQRYPRGMPAHPNQLARTGVAPDSPLHDPVRKFADNPANTLHLRVLADRLERTGDPAHLIVRRAVQMADRVPGHAARFVRVEEQPATASPGYDALVRPLNTKAVRSSDGGQHFTALGSYRHTLPDGRSVLLRGPLTNDEGNAVWPAHGGGKGSAGLSYHYTSEDRYNAGALPDDPKQLARSDAPITLTDDEWELARSFVHHQDHTPALALADSLEGRGSPLHVIVRRALQYRVLAKQKPEYHSYGGAGGALFSTDRHAGATPAVHVFVEPHSPGHNAMREVRFNLFHPKFRASFVGRVPHKEADAIRGVSGAKEMYSSAVHKPKVEPVIPKHAGEQLARFEPVPEARRLLNSYVETHRARFGIPEAGSLPDRLALDLENSKKVAGWFDRMKDRPDHPRVKAAYAALKDELLAQHKHLTDAGVRLVPWTRPGQPYRSSAEMAHDARTNRRVYYFPTDAGFGSGQAHSRHPLNEPVPGQPGVVYNDLLRGVHDYFAHAAGGNQFGPTGELNAWVEHARTFSPLARAALTTETHGQNSWVNFGPHAHLPVAQRPFADQKAGLLPESAQPVQMARPVGGVSHVESALTAGVPRDKVRRIIWRAGQNSTGVAGGWHVHDDGRVSLFTAGKVNGRHGFHHSVHATADAARAYVRSVPGLTAADRQVSANRLDAKSPPAIYRIAPVPAKRAPTPAKPIRTTEPARPAPVATKTTWDQKVVNFLDNSMYGRAVNKVAKWAGLARYSPSELSKITDTEHALARQFANNPADHTPLLMLADSLEEREHPAHLIVRRAVQAQRLNSKNADSGIVPTVTWTEAWPPAKGLEGTAGVDLAGGKGTRVATFRVHTTDGDVYLHGPLREHEAKAIQEARDPLGMGPKPKGKFWTQPNMPESPHAQLTRAPGAGMSAAVAGVTSDRQRVRRMIAGKLAVEAKLKLSGLTDALAVGDGAKVRDALVQKFDHTDDANAVTLAAAWYGLLTGEPRTVVFHTHENGPDALHVWNTDSKPADIHRAANALNVPHVVVGLDGTAYSFDRGNRAFDHINRLKQETRSNAPDHPVQFGTAHLIGAGAGSGADARAAYRALIRSARPADDAPA